MKRVMSVLAAAAVAAGMMFAGGIGHPAAANGPKAENTRSLHYVERYQGSKFTIDGAASADAPMGCNTRLVWSYLGQSLGEMTIKAKCRIQSGHRSGQKVSLQATATYVQPNLPPEVVSKCRTSAASDPETGRVELSCDLELPTAIG